MTLQLLKTTAEPARVVKPVTVLSTVIGTLRYPSSAMSMTVDVQDNNALQCNYLYCPDLNRYYFVNDITLENNLIYRLSCKVDVLMTYATGIKNMDAIIERNAKSWNLYLDDGTLRVYNKPKIGEIVFPNGFNTREYVLLVAGG